MLQSNTYSLSQPRINLRQQVPARMSRPVSTILIRCRRNDHVLNISWPLHDISIKTPGDMPGNMAVEGPDAGVVLFPLENLMEEKH